MLLKLAYRTKVVYLSDEDRFLLLVMELVSFVFNSALLQPIRRLKFVMKELCRYPRRLASQTVKDVQHPHAQKTE